MLDCNNDTDACFLPPVYVCVCVCVCVCAKVCPLPVILTSSSLLLTVCHLAKCFKDVRVCVHVCACMCRLNPDHGVVMETEWCSYHYCPCSTLLQQVKG